MTILVLAVLLVMPLGAESINHFRGICLGDTQDRTQGIDRPQWAGFCTVTATEDKLTIDVSLAGPVNEHYWGTQQVDVLYRDEVGIAPPLMWVNVHGWLSFTILPADPAVSLDIVRAVARDNPDGQPRRRSAELVAKASASPDDTPTTNKMRVELSGATIWIH